MTRVKIHKEYCKGCGYCMDVCRKAVLKQGLDHNKKGYLYVVAAAEENCIGCGMCAAICPDAAIELYREA